MLLEKSLSSSKLEEKKKTTGSTLVKYHNFKIRILNLKEKHILLLLLRSHDIGILSNLESGGLNKFHCLCQVIFSAIQFINEG